MSSGNLARALGNSPDPSVETPWADALKRGRVPGPRLKEHRVIPEGVGMGTACVHAGTYEDPRIGAVVTPIFQSTTFLFSDHSYNSFATGTTRDVPIYTRYGSPNQWSVQEKVATLEGASSSLVFASGMAAISTTLLALTNRGGHIISAVDLYGGSYALLKEDMHQMGRSVTFVEPTDIAAIESAIRPETQVLFFETLTNPLMKAIPLQPLGELARKRNLLLIVDNTFLSPILLRPLDLGAHVVIHSCTKYLNGHSDLVAGVASGSRKYIDRVWAQMLKFGGHLEPMSCFLLERGLKTLELRVQRQTANANALAAALERHPKVARVFHPSLPDYPYTWIHELCPNGFGGMVSFEVAGGDAAALELTERLTIPAIATSLGGVDSLVSLPFNTSHSILTERQRRAIGINPGLVRFSCGIENTDDLIRDLISALNCNGGKNSCVTD
jgi:cystathionine beta-lyase/cystathionine gamma-synthase